MSFAFLRPFLNKQVVIRPMKPCKKCEASKTLDQFYACTRMKDGHHNVCKTCWCEDQKRRRRAA